MLLRKLTGMMFFILLLATFINAQIIVDGDKDAFYNTLTGPGDGYLQLKYYAGNNNGNAYNDVDLSAKVYSSWDTDNLYMYVEVKDDTLAHSAANSYQNDGMELKIDPQPTDSVTNSTFAPNLTLFGGTGSDSLNNIAGAVYFRKIVDGGYVLEFSIPWTSIVSGTETVTPAVDSLFGLAINVHDNDKLEGGTREHSIQWAAVMQDQVWNTPKYLGTAKLLADNKVSFIPTNTMTGVSNPLPYDGTPFWANIDGLKDPVFTSLKGTSDGYLQMQYYAGNNNGNAYSNADLSANVWSSWSDDNLYMYLEVKDDTLAHSAANSYQNDGMELKIDPQATDSVTNSTFAPNLTLFGGTGSDSLNNIAGAQWARRIITGGYALELSIPWTSVVSGTETVDPAVDNVFGLAINVHDNDKLVSGTREHSVQWAAVMQDQVWNTPKYLGTAKLLADNKIDFIPSNNMTGVTNPMPYDGSPFWATIDALKDPVYTALRNPDDGYVQIRSFAYSNNGAPANDADLSSKIWTAWDPTWLYLYEEVMDDTISGNAANAYQDDCIELKIDPQATDSLTNSVFALTLTALGMGTPGVTSADSLTGVTDEDKKWARRIITGGYALEMAIKWSAIISTTETITPKVNNVFGLAINNHDNDGNGRQASIIWAAQMLDAVWNTPKYHGTIKFIANNKLQFIPTNNMTGVTNTTPYNGDDISGVEKVSPQIPIEFAMSQNYPNPFNPTTRIDFSLVKTGTVNLKIYNMLGEEVATLINNEMLDMGYYQADFNASSLSTGIYVYVLRQGQSVLSKKMLLMK